MTTQIIDLSQIDLTGGLRLNGEAIAEVHAGGKRLWPFGVDLLFAGGVGGAFYLPDAGAVFGTVAPAVAGGSLAAVLDAKAGALRLGPEMVINGGPGPDTSGWSAAGSGSLSVENGALKVTNTADVAGQGRQAIALEVGKTYLVSAEIVGGTGLPQVRFGTTANGSEYFLASNPQISTPIVATATVLHLTLRNNGAVAGATGFYANISVREVIGLHARQPSISFSPLLGRAPKERRNLLPESLSYQNAQGTFLSARFQVGVVIGEEAVETINTIHGNLPFFEMAEDTSHGVHWLQLGQNNLIFAAHPWPGDPTVLEWIVKRAGRRYAVVRQYSSTPFVQAIFDLHEGVVASSTFVSAACVPLGNDVFVLRVANNYIGGGLQNYRLGVADDTMSATFLGDGRVSLLVSNMHVQAGTAVYRHQVTGRLLLDITEDGVPSYPFVRPDLSDDRLPTVLPDAVTGDVVIAGRSGSVIVPHSYAAGTTWELGPATYTGGTPGILRAIGDVVGWGPIGKTLTAAERTRLMRFLKRRGAKGLLVPNPAGVTNLVANGTVDVDTTGWSGVRQALLSINSGRLRVVAGATTFPSAVQNISSELVPQRFYGLQATVTAPAASAARIFVGDAVGSTSFSDIALVTAGETRTVGVLFQASTAITNGGHVTLGIQGSPAPGAEAFFDDISVIEYRPEEDW